MFKASYLCKIQLFCVSLFFTLVLQISNSNLPLTFDCSHLLALWYGLYVNLQEERFIWSVETKGEQMQPKMKLWKRVTIRWEMFKLFSIILKKNSLKDFCCQIFFFYIQKARNAECFSFVSKYTTCNIRQTRAAPLLQCDVQRCQLIFQIRLGLTVNWSIVSIGMTLFISRLESSVFLAIESKWKYNVKNIKPFRQYKYPATCSSPSEVHDCLIKYHHVLIGYSMFSVCAPYVTHLLIYRK